MKRSTSFRCITALQKTNCSIYSTNAVIDLGVSNFRILIMSKTKRSEAYMYLFWCKHGMVFCIELCFVTMHRQRDMVFRKTFVKVTIIFSEQNETQEELAQDDEDVIVEEEENIDADDDNDEDENDDGEKVGEEEEEEEIEEVIEEEQEPSEERLESQLTYKLLKLFLIS